MTIRWADAALQDLFEISDYLFDRDPDFPARAVASARQVLAVIEKQPKTVPEVRGGLRKAPLPPTSYLLIYVIRPGGAEVVRLVHSARDWMSFL